MRPRTVLDEARRLAVPVAAALVLSASGGSSASAADTPFQGAWKQGPLHEDFTVQQWLEGCGPRPSSHVSGGGETVQLHQEGDELSFVGGGRVYRTNECYDPMPSLIREMHSRDPSGRSWRTRCSTPAGDPRKTLLQTLVVATSDNHVDVTETGRYEILLAEGKCIADVRRSRGFDKVAVAPATTPAPAPIPVETAAVPKPAPAACVPGAPARLEVRPSRKLLRTGETFAFSASVVDASGCPTGIAPTWSVAPGADSTKRLDVDARGRVTVAKEASDGAVDLVATAGGKSARVTVDVTSPAHYEELLARSGFNAAGESETASIAVLSGESLGGSEVRADDAGARRRLVFAVVIAALALVLGVAWAIVFRRSRKAKAIERELDERHEERVREVESRRRERRAKYEDDLRAHLASAEAAKAQQGRGPASLAHHGQHCPDCRREIAGTDATFCPYDGVRLAPGPADGPAQAMPGTTQGPGGSGALSRSTKICPTCGDRFEGGAAFCGKDGTALVLLN